MRRATSRNPIVPLLLLAMSWPAATATAAVKGSLKGKTLVLKQTFDLGLIAIDDQGPNGALRWREDLVTYGYAEGPADNLTVRLSEGSTCTVTLDLAKPIVGNLTIKAGAGDQGVRLENNALVVGGNLIVDLGTGDGIFKTNFRNLTVGGSMKQRGINDFWNSATLHIAKNLTVLNKKEGLDANFFDQQPHEGAWSVHVPRGTGSRHHPSRGHGDDRWGWQDRLEGRTVRTVESADLHLFEAQIGGDLRVRSSGSSQHESFVMYWDCRVLGNVNVDLGPGRNAFFVRGLCEGASIKCSGGSSDDYVECEIKASSARAKFGMGSGADHFKIIEGALLESLQVDFGKGTDKFSEDAGMKYGYAVSLKNLP